MAVILCFNYGIPHRKLPVYSKLLTMEIKNKTLIPASHYFIHLRKGSKNTRFGKYGLSQTTLLPQIIYTDFQEFASEFGKNEAHNKPILIYIHGFMADFELFEQKAGFILQNELFNPILENYPTIISLKWETSPDYRESIKSAESTGASFYSLLLALQNIIQPINWKQSWSFLCHSMGNRILAGMIKADLTLGKQLNYGTLCLMAADIPSDIFETEWSILPEIAEKVVVFINEKDRTLEVANWIVAYPRLGKTGPTKELAHVFVIDASQINDHEGIVPKISKHRYYYASASIRALLCSIFKGNESVSLNGKTYFLPGSSVND